MSITQIQGSTYYKFKHLTRDSFPDLSPDDADEFIGAQEALQTELEREAPGCSVGIEWDYSGYHLIVRTGHPLELDENCAGWKVVTEGYPL